MTNLIAQTADASKWVEHEKARRYGGAFDRLAGAVVWIDEPGPNHEAIPGRDPARLIAEINDIGWPLFHEHDPGSPIGRVVAANEFVDALGVRFVAAIFGYYGDGQRLRFSDLGVDPAVAVSPPSTLGPIPGDPWLEIAADPREVDAQWLKDLLTDPPYRAKIARASHNAADPLKELIEVGFPFVMIVWNPMVKTIGEAAGKDIYAAGHAWLRKLWDKLEQLRDPILVIHSFQDECQVKFMFRGRDPKRNYAAHDALSFAGAQAARLIRGIKASGTLPTSLGYEFDADIARWYPSYAILADGRIVKDTPFLIAIEQLPQAVSLGLLNNE